MKDKQPWLCVAFIVGSKSWQWGSALRHKNNEIRDTRASPDII